MTHFSYEQWKRYVTGELNENVREEYETHLYTCDQCLDMYLQAMAEHENEFPALSNEAQFTNSIMSKVSEMNIYQSKQESSKKKPFYQHAVFHYTLAAVMTLILMATGVFSSITKYADNVHEQEFQEQKPSVTEGLVNKTFAWMDSFEANNKEANK